MNQGYTQEDVAADGMPRGRMSAGAAGGMPEGTMREAPATQAPAAGMPASGMQPRPAGGSEASGMPAGGMLAAEAATSPPQRPGEWNMDVGPYHSGGCC